MTILEHLFDPFYNDVKRKKFFYEQVFQKIIESIDIENYTNYLNNWLYNREDNYDKNSLNKTM